MQNFDGYEIIINKVILNRFNLSFAWKLCYKHRRVI